MSDLTQNTFDALAFPVIRVKYSNGNWNASLRRDVDKTYRARESYDHATGGGARGALPAALKCWEKARDDMGGFTDEHLAIPGDYDSDTYVFLMVPKYLLNAD